MLSGETMMSICKTLETIDFCCNRDAYSDAYTLLRKCRDDLMQYLFVLNVIQNKHGLTDEEAEKFTINSESMIKMIGLIRSYYSIFRIMKEIVCNLWQNIIIIKDRRMKYGLDKI